MTERVAKNRVDLQSNEPAPTQREVHASLNVQAERIQAEGIINALSGWGRHLGAKAEKKSAEEDRLHEQRGWLDQATGKEDEALVNREAYQRGRQKQRVLSTGLEWFNNSNAERERLQREDPNFDFSTWKHQQLESYLSQFDSTDPEAMAQANAMGMRFMESVEAGYVSTAAKLELADAENDVSKTFAEAFRGNGIQNKDGLSRLIQDAADNTALTREETQRIAFNHLTSQIEIRGERNADQYEAFLNQAEGMQEEFANDSTLSPRFAAAMERGRREVETLRESERRDRINADLGTWSRVHRAIDEGTFSTAMGQDLIDRGYANAPQVGNWIASATAARERAYERAKNDADKAQIRLDVLQRMSMGEGRIADPKVTQEISDEMFSNAFLALNDARRAGDADAEQEAARGMAYAIQLARKNQTFPTGLKEQFNRIDLSNPTLTAEVGESFLAMDRAGIGGFVRGHISDSSYVALSMYADMRKGQFDPEAASQMLTSMSNRDPAEARNELRSRSNEVRKAAVAVADGAANVQAVQSEIEKYAALYIMAGSGVDAALDHAKTAAKERLVKVGSVMLPANSMISEDPANLMGSYLKNHLRPYVDGKLPGALKDRDVYMAPVPSSPGTFVPLVDGMEPLVIDGKVQFVTEADMAARNAEARQRKTAANAQARREEQELRSVEDEAHTNPALRMRGLF